jgi:hypothetical protein
MWIVPAALGDKGIDLDNIAGMATAFSRQLECAGFPVGC